MSTPVAADRPDAGPSSVAGRRLPHLPALDGLRGVAVIGVLLFHAELGWAKGGFLGVSTFFTLSGFLITNLLVREWSAGERIRLGVFWQRRFRRLMPAALVTLAATTLVTWWLGSGAQLRQLRGDVIAAAANVANWRFLASGTSYADLFADPSPVQHFWSLAIEEQFYLVFPLLVAGLLAVLGRRRLGITLGGLAVASTLLSVLLADRFDRTYYGTDTRAAELLVGAVLAVWWIGREERDPDRLGLANRGLQAVGVAAFLATITAWSVVTETTERLARGGFALHALAVSIVILAATAPGPLRTTLSWRPLRAVGLVSYGLYLYHWPVFLFLDAERTRLGTAPLLALRLAVTVTIAVASYFLLELPIRHGTRLPRPRIALGAAAAGIVTVAGLAVVTTFDPPASTVPFADAEIAPIEADVEVVVPAPTAPPASAAPAPGPVDTEPVTEPTGATETSPPAAADQGPQTQPLPSTAPAATTTAPVPPVLPADTVMILGDSGMVEATPAIVAAFSAAGSTTFVKGAGPGFGITNPIFTWRESWTGLIAEQDPDLVVVMLGSWDVRFQAEQGDDAYLAVIDEAIDILGAGGARIIWASVMPSNERDPWSTERVFVRLPDLYPGTVDYLDLGPVLAGPTGDWPRSYVAVDGSLVLLRKRDVWHLCPEGAARVADAFATRAAELRWAPPPIRPGGTVPGGRTRCSTIHPVRVISPEPGAIGHPSGGTISTSRSIDVTHSSADVRHGAATT